jgi:hypothetical protein
MECPASASLVMQQDAAVRSFLNISVTVAPDSSRDHDLDPLLERRHLSVSQTRVVSPRPLAYDDVRL